MESEKLFNELKWRGLFSQSTGDIKNIFNSPTTFYVGIDPTADSLGIHHMIGLLVSKILQKYGHKPIILVGGATCAIGDPSGKSSERNAISTDEVKHNIASVSEQISKIIDFDSKLSNGAIMVNNNDWTEKMTLIDFMRSIGKKITVNYMMAKENVKKRLERDGNGISCSEFLYGLLQGQDFLHLYEKYGCKCQIAGSDNISNIATGLEIIRKTLGTNDACSFTWDLITTADGRKFGKTEGNTVWLDTNKTSPYEFMQFWINQSDADAIKFAKMFLVDNSIEEIEEMIKAHNERPEKRLLQNALAKYMTTMVHGEDAYNKAVNASHILFGKSTANDLASLDDNTFKAVMRDVPTVETCFNDINGTNVLDFLCTVVKIGSKSELRKLINSNAISINKNKITDTKAVIDTSMFLPNSTMLVQKGKKKYTLVISK